MHRFLDSFHGGLARLDSRPARLRSFLNRRYGRTPAVPPFRRGDVCCEPSREDIQRAIDEKDFETRGFQNPEVEAEYSALDVPECYEWLRKYHAKRVAFHVVNGWQDRIVLNEDKQTIKDGLHRLKAAIFMGWETVDVDVA